MDGSVFEQFFDEHGNIHVRISDEVVLLTPDESARALEVFHQLKKENAKLKELVAAYDSALMRMCDQTQGFYSHSDSYPCDECVLGKGHGFDRCGVNELQDEACKLGIEMSDG